MKVIIRSRLLAVTLACPVVFAVDTPSHVGPTLSELLTVARSAITAKDWARALSELKTAALEEPRNAEVHNLLGYRHRKQSMPNLARAFEHYPMNKQPAAADKHLAALQQLCGNKTCEEYVDLAQALCDDRAKSPG
jgi:uncharacterized protein HemY